MDLKKFNRNAWLTSQLRRISSRYPPFYEFYNLHKEVYYITSKKGKQLRRVRFLCNKCNNKFPKKQIRLDHIIPCKQQDENIWQFAERLFCEVNNIQLLCKTCHDAKSKEENKLRKSAKLKKSS